MALFFFNRLLLAALHFNENSTRQQAKNQNGDSIYINVEKGIKT